MSVLVLSKGGGSENSYKPFDVRDVHTYAGSFCTSKSKPADQPRTAADNKHVMLERHITALEITTSKTCRSDELLPQISWKKSCSQPPLYRGILKNISGGKEKSLKTKQVSFADLKGKVLTQIKEIPKLSHFEQSLEEDLDSMNPCLQEIPKQSISPIPTLQRVATKNEWYYAKQDCMERLRSKKVSLQEVFLERNVIKGKIRVVNISYEKSVLVRWTKDSWKNSADTTAKYSKERGNTNHASDCFEFYLPCDSGCIEFAIQYTVDGRAYWDNNDGKNYQLRIYQA